MTKQTHQSKPGGERPRRARTGPRADDAAAGFIADVIPIMRDGLVVMRALLDVAIQRLDEIEEGRSAHVRRETYETILSVMDEEIERLEAEESSEARDAQLDALRSIRHVLERQLRRSAPGARERRPDTSGDDDNGHPPAKPRSRSVTID